MSALLGIGGGVGILAGAAIVEHLSWHWLFWLPLVVIVVAAIGTWRFVPESPVRVPGRINWPAAVLMSAGMTLVLIAISETTDVGLGLREDDRGARRRRVVCAAWVAVEVRSAQPLIDMTLMRVRAVWTANLTAFLLGAGMYASFVVFPQFAQLPKSTGFGFGASVVGSALYLLPSTIGMFVVGFAAGRIAARFGSKPALVAGSLVTAACVRPPRRSARRIVYDMLLSSALLGIGIGLAFAALGNIVVQAVDDHQTGVASGMNTVMRTIGGALGGQLTATFLADHVRNGYPTVTGFTDSFVLSTCFLVVCTAAALLVPGPPFAAVRRPLRGSRGDRLMVRVRFAPSPTGTLHVGNALSAVANRRFGDWLLLRIDDTDPARNLPGGEEAIVEDLRWLGIEWDDGPVRQSERVERHLAAARDAGTAAAVRRRHALARRRLADVPSRDGRRRHRLRHHARHPRLRPPPERGAACRVASRARYAAAACHSPRPRRRGRREEAVEARGRRDRGVAAGGRLSRRGGAGVPGGARAADATMCTSTSTASGRSRSTWSRSSTTRSSRRAPASRSRPRR